MGEHRGERRSEQQRVTIAEAASILGISKDAVRMRVRRLTLPSEKTEGRVYVWLNTDLHGDLHGDTRPDVEAPALVEELRDRVRSLERRLDEEGESRRRADTIIAQLAQANTALNEQLRELEAPQGAAEAVTGVPATQGADEAAESRTDPRWMQSRWVNWLVPVLLGYVLPIVFSVLGAVYVYIRTVNDQAIAAVLGTIGTLLGVGLSLTFYLRLRRQQRQVEAQARWWQGHAERLQRYVENDTDQLREFGEHVRDIKDNAARTNEALDELDAELEKREKREAWIKERLKENPELEQRMGELREEYEREQGR